MKKLTFLIVLLAAFAGMSAQNQKIKQDSISMSKTALSQSKSITDLDKNIPKNAKIQSVDMVAKAKGKVINVKGTTNEWSKDVRKLLDSVDVGTKVYFDFLYKVPPDEKMQQKALVIKVL